MRIWDLDPGVLCDRHLLGEHRELHAVWSVLTNGRSGYANHPETVRWRGRLAALYVRHEAQIAEWIGAGFAIQPARSPPCDRGGTADRARRLTRDAARTPRGARLPDR